MAEVLDLLNRLCGSKGLTGEPALCLPFRQGWLEETQVGFEPGHVRLYVESNRFRIAAVLKDRCIFSNATGFNQKLWLLGDVFEIFLQVAPETYYEFHLSPNNQQLQLRWTCETFAAVKRGEYSLQDALIPAPALFYSETTVVPEEAYWSAYLEIPFEGVELGGEGCAGDVRIAFTRYDYSEKTGEESRAVLSGTPAYPKVNFHMLDYWHPIRDIGEITKSQ